MSTQRMACRPERLSEAEGRRKKELMDELSRSVEEVEELETGFRFQYRAGAVEWALLAEFVELERGCCPFFTFTAQVGPEGAPLSLALTGEEGVKAYLREHGAGAPGPNG